MRILRPLAALGLAATAFAAPGAQAPPLRVVTLSTVLSEIAREVGGGQVSVVSLVRPGVDPHTFNPSPADIRAVADAQVVLASGLSLEAYLDRLVAGSGSKGHVLSVGDTLPSAVPAPGAPAGGERDPHWWHGLDNMVAATDIVRAEFSRARPAAAETFAANARAYEARLGGLKAWTAGEVARLPPNRRHLVTSHDAFGCFARDYGFEVHAINGLSTDSEADARHLARLIDLIRREGIPVVFAEESANPRLVENLVRETGVRLGATLYADGLGPPGSGAETFDSMYRHNVRAIVDALSAR
jgi:zinc/manganese transport system substrate-binding protein